MSFNLDEVPTKASYPGSDHRSWDEIPLGIGRDGEVFWKVTKDPHMLIAGPTGSGKSVAQRNIISHCIQHSDMWEIFAIDLKGIEFTSYVNQNIIKHSASTKEEALELLQEVENVMNERYEQLKNYEFTNFTSLPSSPPALMIIVDDIISTAIPYYGETKTGIEEKIMTIIAKLARLGRAAGIHIVLGAQRVDAKILPPEIKANFTARYATGPLGHVASHMLLDTDEATQLSSELHYRGIGIVRFYETSHLIKTYI